MVKFGKEFRKYQVKQWKDSYINYKVLKQEIRTIRNNIDNAKHQSRETNSTVITDIGHPSLKPLELVPEDSIIIEVQDLQSLYKFRYGNELKRFIDLLEKEFRKCYIHFVSQEKELYKRVNGHCYSTVVYKDYNILNVYNEIKEIALTLKLAKQLNCFINDNVMALKKILKKFDKKYQKYFGIIAPKYILTHLTSQNSDLEYLLQFKLIDESTSICENNLKTLLNLYKRLRGNNINNINNNPKEDETNKIEDKNNQNNNLIINNSNNLDNNINILKNRIYEYLDSIDELTYFKIQYREWFYYAKQNERLVKNNPKIFENDIYNPILSSTYHKDSLLEKCLGSKNALKEVERSQSPLSHSNKTNLILIYIQAAIYGSMLTNIFPVISYYFDLYIQSDFKTLFLVPLILTYIGYLLPYTLFVYFDDFDKNNFLMHISYIISYILILLSSFLLILVKNDESKKTKNFIFIAVSRLLLGFANNQIFNRKYITLYLPKFKLPRVSKLYLISELIGIFLGPFITFILNYIEETDLFGLNYTHFNCVGWYGCFVAFIFGLIHFIFFIKPLSSEFIMVKDESNITGNKYYQRSESEINRKQYLKEQNLMYKKTYKSMKKKRESQRVSENNDTNGINNSLDKIIIKNVPKDDIENENKDEKNDIKTNNDNDLGENLINTEMELENEANTSLDVSTGGNIALTDKQKNMINEIEKVLEKRNEECNFNDMNQIPKSINAIIIKEKNSFGYINQNLLLLFIIFFVCSLIKTNLILNYIYYIQENFYTDENYIKEFCLLLLLFTFFQISKIFFIFPFYQVNYKFRIFMLFSVAGLAIFNIPLIINSLYDNKYIFIIMNVLLIVACNIIEICCSCYLSFILSPDWKIFGRGTGHWTNYVIIFGKILGGIICMLLNKEDYLNHWVLIGITFAFFICIFIMLFFTRILKIKGITRVIRKGALEINLDN